MKDFTMILPEDLLVCPSGKCIIELEDGKFRKNTFSDAWVIEGDLKVGNPQEGDTEYNIFDMRGDLNEISSFESNEDDVTD